MFAAGDLVVYGGEGVCRVESIGPSGMDYDRSGRLYYHLAPLYRSGTVLTPVDTAVLMRPVMSRGGGAGADRGAARPAAVQAGGCRGCGGQGALSSAGAAVRVPGLAAMVHTICRQAGLGGTPWEKVSQMDERYLKRAEEQLYGEMAAALGIARDAVVSLSSGRRGRNGRKSCRKRKYEYDSSTPGSGPGVLLYHTGIRRRRRTSPGTAPR